jgi:hypothetical protein
MVITKGILLHQQYLAFHTCLAPRRALQLIDDTLSCEDFSMNFMLSALTGKVCHPEHVSIIITYFIHVISPVSIHSKFFNDQ